MSKSCYLCGATDRPLTADHVIPKVLFPKPRPNNLITEPACEPCNGGLSKDDALFAVYVSAALGRNDAGKWVWDNKATKSVLAKSAPLANRLINDSFKKEVLTEIGIVEADILTIPQERLERVLFRMAKGLLRHIDRTFDYSQSKFNLDRLWPTLDTADMIRENSAKMAYMERGHGVFRCQYGLTKDDPRHAAFFFFLYDAVGFIVTTIP